MVVFEANHTDFVVAELKIRMRQALLMCPQWKRIVYPLSLACLGAYLGHLHRYLHSLDGD